jgi:hypothetical protein
MDLASGWLEWGMPEYMVVILYHNFVLSLSLRSEFTYNRPLLWPSTHAADKQPADKKMAVYLVTNFWQNLINDNFCYRQPPQYSYCLPSRHLWDHNRSTSLPSKPCNVLPNTWSLEYSFIVLVLFPWTVQSRSLWYDMIYLLLAIGLPPGSSSTLHIYTQTIHRSTQFIN